MKILIILTSLLLHVFTFAQSKKTLVSGPWAGNIEIRNATIWLEVASDVTSVAVKYKKKSDVIEHTVKYKGFLGNEFNPVKIPLNGLDMNTEYQYSILINGKPVALPFTTSFKTKDLWEHRKPAPAFNFLAGSCSYFNESLYDRPGKPYGLDSSIFVTMGATPASFNLWLGDSWYTREADYNTAWGLNYRVSRDRSMPVVQKFMASMPQYHIWDDHDYGPNNSGKNYHLKESSRKIFENYTLNPGYGEEGKGIYTFMSYNDADFFLTDNRYFRSDQKMADSINGKPDPSKTYFGAMQMEWLKNSLLYSNAAFKFIVSGSQVLNPVSTRDCMRAYSYEFNDLISFITLHKISGVIFLSGDRHHSEVIKYERPGAYTLYDVTVSPLTATVGKAQGRRRK